MPQMSVRVSASRALKRRVFGTQVIPVVMNTLRENGTGWLIGVGASAHVIFLGLMLAHVEPFHTYFYLFAWWTYLPVIGAINYRKSGRSYVIGGQWQLIWLCSCSLIVWLFFEIWNFRLDNWLYVGVITDLGLRWTVYALAFATVLPAVLETDLLFDHLGVARRVRGLAFQVSARWLRVSVVSGFVMMALVALLPRYCFPLVWVALVLILDPVLYHLDKEASFLGQASRGSYQRLTRLMLAGLSCGVLWEFWNYGSGAKWIYDIPFFDQWKVFEMPLPGFLGFMPFALECYLFWELFRLARKTLVFTDRRYQVLALIVAISYCALTFYGIDVMTVIWL